MAENVETDEVSAPGSLETNPNRVAHATLPVAGKIASVAVKLGDSVREGQTLLTVESPDIDAYLYLFDAKTLTSIRSFTGSGGSVRAVAFSHDGRRAVSGDETGEVRLWTLP